MLPGTVAPLPSDPLAAGQVSSFVFEPGGMSIVPIVGVVGFLGSGLLLLLAYRLQRRERVLAVAAQIVPSPEVMRKPDRDDESSMPRWRRPSVLAARAGRSPTRRMVAAAAASVTAAGVALPVGRRRARRFNNGGPEGPRAVSRYDDVTILDQPNEAYGMPVGSLVTGDEVAVIERDEIWTNVATPDGKTGWVLGMTLELGVRAPAEQA